MAWELDSTQYKPCPCGKGRIRIEEYSDEWNRYDSRYEIECEYCKAHYHIEYSRLYKPHRGECAFLVENGKTTEFHVFPNSFEEFLVHTYSKDKLRSIYQSTVSLTSSKDVNKEIVYQHKKWYKTVKLSIIVQHIWDAIEKYDTFEYNKKIIAAKREECAKVKRFYLGTI